MDQTFETRYASLNKAQKQAVDTTDGPVMVIAGPGSGKTELLSLRVGNILRQGTARASNILLLTFTETAARNMRERLEALIGPDAFRVAIYTFHGFCTDVIGRYPEYFFGATHFRPASDLLQSEILETIFKKLPHKHPLASFHPELGFSYLKETQTRIKDIKKGGLTPSRFKEILTENEHALTSLNRILQEHLPERIGKDAIDAFEQIKQAFLHEGSSLGSMYAQTITHAIESCEVTEKTTPLSEWKSTYTGKDDAGTRVFKDTLALPKLYALGDLYDSYQEALHKEGYFDYEDMILEVVQALSAHVSLRTELEELYHYIMVDEFQDTNNAQLSLVKALSSNDVHEGRPNVCVVGDDDQAIYKFQGAEISNIHSFKELYKDVEVIVLTENYRSTQKILDFARAIVTQGVNRLETRYKEIRKDLVAKNTKLPVGAIHTLSCAQEEEEYATIAELITERLKGGTPPDEIAVIAREHKQLTALLPYLDAKHIPYTYTRKENVFDETHVKELVMLCRFLATVGDTSFERDDLLPQILAFPFWGLNRIAVWTIAEHAKSNNLSWLSAMQASDDEHIRTLALFLIELGVASQTAPLEIILDTLIGSREHPLVPEGDHDDEDFALPTLTLSSTYTSPYKEYYFGKDALAHDGSAYIHFLSSLKVFVHALREYKDGNLLRVHDVGDFVDMHTAYKIPLTNETAFAHNEHSVQLLTSHGAKGLEFDVVFIIAVHDSVWAGKPKGSKLAFPVNLPLASAGDAEDDFIRLLYVALTRARHTLYLSHHASKLRFLNASTLPDTDEHTIAPPESSLLVEGLHVYQRAPFAENERALLQKVVEGYMLSPTHLNNFLHIVDGGPMKFLEQNLLRFPQAKTSSSVYGTAVHAALEHAIILTKKTGAVPPLETLLDVFRKELHRGRLLPYEEENKRSRGEKVLKRYYELRKNSITGNELVELNFARQAVVVGGALLTGKIDRVLEHEDGSWTVVDVKTGKGYASFDDGTTAYDKIKLHHYRYQLMMYKLLVEHSRDYARHSVTSALLEFVEEETDGAIQEITLDLRAIDQAEYERFKQLVQAVYTKIVSLDLTLDTSGYEQTLDGIKAFEDDLIAGRI